MRKFILKIHDYFLSMDLGMKRKIRAIQGRSRTVFNNNNQDL